MIVLRFSRFVPQSQVILSPSIVADLNPIKRFCSRKFQSLCFTIPVFNCSYTIDHVVSSMASLWYSLVRITLTEKVSCFQILNADCVLAGMTNDPS